MRPANFPTLRLPQFGALIYHRQHLFPFELPPGSLAAIPRYRAFIPLDNPLSLCASVTGACNDWEQTVSANLIINAVVPVLVGYARITDQQAISLDKAVAILEQLPRKKTESPDSGLISDFRFARHLIRRELLNGTTIRANPMLVLPV